MRFDGWFKLASHLKKTLNELMSWDGPMTHRQFTAWQAWLLMQWDDPNLDHHYMMQVASAVDMREGNRTLNDYKIDFGTRKLSFSQESVGNDEPFLVDGKPFGPRRLTKEDVGRLERQNLFARVKAAKPKDNTLQLEMSKQIDEVIKHNEKAGKGGRCKVTPNGLKDS